jgi:hypothetical protein
VAAVDLRVMGARKWCDVAARSMRRGHRIATALYL